MAARANPEAKDAASSGGRDATKAPGWRWRSTDLFESEEEAWILVSRWRAQEESSAGGAAAYEFESGERRTQERPRRG